MAESIASISIPAELQQFQKNVNNSENITPKTESPDFGVKIIKNSSGNVSHVEYYSDTGEILKKIYYECSSISNIEHYRNNRLFRQEYYKNGLLTQKITFNKCGQASHTITYLYNKKNELIAIKKLVQNRTYEVEYGYDELNRVNSRKLKLNSKILNEQNYRYDILDRVVEYNDKNQRIKVSKINNSGQLIEYSILDIAGNEISVLNKFMCSEYIGTIMDLNGHKTSVKDESYTDNVMLKKPFISEDDLDMILSHMLNNNESMTTRRNNIDITESIIKSKTETRRILPITVRKIQLFNKSVI